MALQPARRLLDRFGAPHRLHQAIGDKACLIAGVARDLHCDNIVMSTARKRALVRMIENSTTNRVLKRTTVPIVVIAGEPASGVKRCGIPAGAGAALASLLFAAAA